VGALGRQPGIYSARYAGSRATDAANISKLLHNLRNIGPPERGAVFTCVLVLYQPGGHYECFEGQWHGQIADQPAGTGGFGYDPVFYLPALSMTAAQLPAEMKNKLSHRAKAFQKLKKYLRKVIIGEKEQENGA
jgi:XTP/dITP diphosphohydrolase